MKDLLKFYNLEPQLWLIINKIRLERNDIAWIGIEIKGTNAKIKIVDILHAFVLGYSQNMFNAIVDMINDDLNSK